MEKDKSLLVPAINVNDLLQNQNLIIFMVVEKFSRRNTKATDVMMSGKVAIVAGFGDVGKGSAASLDKVALEFWSLKQIQFVLYKLLWRFEVVLMEDMAKQILLLQLLMQYCYC